MNNIIEEVNNELKKSFVKLGFNPDFAYLSESNRPELADYQINSCFNIAKELHKNPFDIATQISDAIRDININGINAFISVEPSKPGFVNIKFSNSLLYDFCNKLLDDDDLCVNTIDIEKLKLDNGKIPKCILLDYGGANVAKPLHVGHLRVAIIGEALKRLYNRLNIKTIADVHLGDYGLQMGLVIEQLKDENKIDSFTINDLEIIYPKASLRAKGNKDKGIEPDLEFNERAHLATKKLQDNVEPDTSIWKKILKIMN